jgi:DNA-binding CsgD family transcriptional regulator
MASVTERTMEWIDFTVDALTRPSAGFPVEDLGRRLIDTFELDVAALTWREPDGIVSITPVTRPGATHGGLGAVGATELMIQASNSQLLAHHPLMLWTNATRSLAPQSLNRVPAAIRTTERSREVTDLLHAVGVDQELSLALAFRDSDYVVYSLNRAGADDFSDEDLHTATRLQPLLIAMRCQAQVLGQFAPDSAVAAYGLTGRELAVLQLLATGKTSLAIGSTLGCTRRTAEKHVEHLYRKLKVSDRVSAIRVARQDGLLPPTLAER